MDGNELVTEVVAVGGGSAVVSEILAETVDVISVDVGVDVGIVLDELVSANVVAVDSVWVRTGTTSVEAGSVLVFIEVSVESAEAVVVSA